MGASKELKREREREKGSSPPVMSGSKLKRRKDARGPAHGLPEIRHWGRGVPSNRKNRCFFPVRLEAHWEKCLLQSRRPRQEDRWVQANRTTKQQNLVWKRCLTNEPIPIFTCVLLVPSFFFLAPEWPLSSLAWRIVSFRETWPNLVTYFQPKENFFFFLEAL